MTKKRILLHKGGMNVSTTGLGENWATSASWQKRLSI